MRTCHCNIIRRHVTATAHDETAKLEVENHKFVCGISDGIRREYSTPSVPSLPKDVCEEVKSFVKSFQRALTKEDALSLGPVFLASGIVGGSDTDGHEVLPADHGALTDTILDGICALGAVEPGSAAKALIGITVDCGEDGIDVSSSARKSTRIRCGTGVLCDEVGHGHHAGSLSRAAGVVVLAVLVFAGLEQGVGNERCLFFCVCDSVFGERVVQRGSRGGSVGTLVREWCARAGCSRGRNLGELRCSDGSARGIVVGAGSGVGLSRAGSGQATKRKSAGHKNGCLAEHVDGFG